MNSLHIILGNNIDTHGWFRLLKKDKKNLVICLDYDMVSDMKIIKGNIYVSTEYMELIKRSDGFRNIRFYKSLYAYPLLK